LLGQQQLTTLDYRATFKNYHDKFEV